MDIDRIQKIMVLKRYKEPSVPISQEKNAVTSSGDLDQLNTVTSYSDPPKTYARFLKMDRFKGKGGE